MLSEYSDGHTLQAMRGPDRKTRIGSDAASIENQDPGGKRSSMTVREKEKEKQRKRERESDREKEIERERGIYIYIEARGIM